MKRQLTARLGSLLLLVAAWVVVGCAGRAPIEVDGAVILEVGPWEGPSIDGRVVRTPRYQIHTTLTDSDRVAELAGVLEAAYLRACQITGLPPRDEPEPLVCYIFQTRAQWEAYTRRHAGVFAPLYLRITRGGYTLGDRFVIYDLGRNATASVAAHESFHQFVARRFVTRPPPALEEGLATLMEHVTLEDGQIRWDVQGNSFRRQRLRSAVAGGQDIPLERLLSMHAGHVVGASPAAIDSFYAHAWALALLMTSDPDYAPILQSMLRHLSTHPDPTAPKPLLVEYFGPIEQIESRFESARRAFSGR